jgi:tRNA nucleotidyltransferase/poly(A) polymerase
VIVQVQDIKLVTGRVGSGRVSLLTEWLIKPLTEDVKLPIEVGDTVLMGRFKNKKVTVKSIDYNEKGDLLINGRPALKFRLTKQNGKKLLPQKTTDKGSVAKDPDMRGAEFKGIRANKKENVNENKITINVPGDIKGLHRLFKKNKKQLYIVGGAVRDAILGKKPKDFDLATDAKPDEVLKIAKSGGFKTYEVGKSFGVVVVGGHEIATFRKDIGKGRRPDAVDFSDIQGDVKRRDLTINAMFYDIGSNEVVDLTGGLKDLKAKIIKTVGNPNRRFDEDPLRKLRALRFQAVVGGKMDKETEMALLKNPSLKGVSFERIREEFVKGIEKGKSPKLFMEACDKFGFTKQIFPKLNIAKPYPQVKDYVLFIASILRNNKVQKLGKQLNALKYSAKDANNIQFLVYLKNFKPENIYMIKKAQDKTTLTPRQIVVWGGMIGKDFRKLATFKLSVKAGGDEFIGLKGKEIGDKIKELEKKKFLNEMIPSPSRKGINKNKTDRMSGYKKVEEIAVRKKPKTFRDIYNSIPIDLKKRVMNLKNFDQRRDAHPEGNVLKHTIAVTNRALKTGDIDFALSALFHDIGKDSTAKIHPKKGFWTHYGHEKVSAKLVLKHKKWIQSLGGDVDDIHYIVKNHMRMKVFDKMRWHKQDKMRKDKAFGKLQKFTTFDKGGRGISDGKINKKTLDSYMENVVYSIIEDGDFAINLNENKIKKVIGIYGGRFQPYGPHHHKTFKWLQSKVDDAYITTSDIKKPPRHPMNFQEKARHMAKMGVPKNKIRKEKVPLVSKELLKKFDPKTTAVVYIFGAKDAGRLSGGKKKDGSPGYFQDYKKNIRNIKGYEEHGYFLVAPHVSMKIGSNEVSGTTMRNILGSPKIKDEDRPKVFKKLFGYYDKGLYNMMTNKFKKLFEFYNQSSVKNILKEVSALGDTVTPSDLDDEGLYDFFNSFGDYKRISPKHAEILGWEVVGDIIGKNAKDPGFDFTTSTISRVDTVTFGKTINQNTSNTDSVSNPFPKYQKYMKGIVDKMGWEIVKFFGSNKHNKGFDDSPIHDMGTATAGKKNTEKPEDPKKLKDFHEIIDITEQTKELLLMGGAYGHMSHPFDDNNLTFSDLKQIVINGLGGKLDREDGVTEKLDGQNLMVSWIDGKLRAARNKGHIKNFGKTAPTTNGIKSMFSGRGNIEKAFVGAMKDLEKSIGSLNDKQKDKVFGNGKRWMNLEVMYPATANVVDYDVAEIVFHGTLEYDESGRPVGQPKDSARMLAGMIKQTNNHIQKMFKIGKPNFLSVPKHQDFGKMKNKYLGQLKKLQSQYGLSDKDTLGEYHESYWREYVFNASKQFGVKLKPAQFAKLIRRWAYFDKGYKIPEIKKDYKDHPKFLDWITSTDKQDHTKIFKQNIKPFEILFFSVGAEILKNISGYMAVNPNKTIQKMRKEMISAMKDLQKPDKIEKLKKLKIQIEKLQKIGGLDAIVPSEGIVFKYKGNTYKFTGAFAPINQILGSIKFG